MKHECGLDVTYCDDCDVELEVGQVGQCEDCTPEKTYTFSELSEPAKDKARDAYRYTDGYPYDDWWDSVYEDAGRVAAILGLDIMETCRTRAGKAYQTPAINFSGFWSQGDGACFQGSYGFNPKATEEMNAYCNDAELLSIATELYILQLARRLQGLEPFTASITTSGNYSHSGTMSVEVHFEEDEEDPLDDITDEVTSLMVSFADWIYNSLEAEYEYLTSDEVVDRQIEEETFDESGSCV